MNETSHSNPADKASPPLPVRRSSIFSLSRQHSAFSATLLLMVSSALSAVLGLARTKFISYMFGAGHLTDAYVAAFQLPDMINYFLIGGVASIALVSMLNRYREAGDDEGADQALSVVLTGMIVVLGAAILVAAWIAPLYTRLLFPKFDAETAALCTHLTRLLLPAQLFLFAGGVLGSRLLVRKIFLYQAAMPLVYNFGILVGGLLLARRVGIDSLAYGVLGGALVGSLLLNAIGALRSGLKFQPVLNLRHPAFVEWFRLSLPLMAGVSLAMADKWIVGYFAAGDSGGITMLNNAKTLFNAPLTIVGGAAGSASLPFFSSLFAQEKLWEFNTAVNGAVSRLIAFALMMTAWMVALALPIVSFLKGGAYSGGAVTATGHYFALFAVSLALWSAQGIYARAFYAARNTIVPALSGTLVTLASIPVYGLLFHRIGIDGLVIASNLGMLAHTVALAILLHRFRLVSIASLEFGEIGRAAIAAAAGYLATSAVVHALPRPAGFKGDLLVLLAGSLVWAGVCYAFLVVCGSKLPGQVLRRRS